MSTTKTDAIRPFTFHAPQAELDELRRRIGGMVLARNVPTHSSLLSKPALK